MKKSFKRWICCFLTVLMLVSTMMGSVTVSAASTLKKGSTFTSGQYKYKVTTLKGKTGEVALVGVTKKSVTSVKIPNTVTKGKYKFSVTSIADGALKGCTKLKTVTTNKKLKKIGKNAFSGCSKLVKLNIKSTKLTSVGKNALKGINKKAVIQVPKAKKTAYKKILKNKGQKSTVKVTVSGTTAAAPSTEAPETEAPKTEAPETEAPTETPETEAPKTEAPTETPETEAPKTEAPTETPETEAPKTEAPTETPETEAPKTEAPTEAPETEAPKTEAPTETPETEAPKTEAPTEAPKPTTPPQADAPQQSGPSFDEPSFDEPQTSAPTPSPEPETKPAETEEPKTEAPTETPETEAPTEAAKPTTPPQADTPQQSGPSFDEPSVDEPQTSAPTTPSTEPETKPAETEEPKTEAPTETPETEAPTEAPKPTTPPQADAPQQDGPSADEPQTSAPTTPSTEPETKPTETEGTKPNHTHANVPNALVRIQDVEPTCTEPGHKNCWKCTVCGEEFHSIKYHMSEESKPTGHQFTVKESKPATCTTDGSVSKICEKCGAKEVEVLPKTGHKWGSKSIIKEPTCYEFGLEGNKCSVCGEVRNQQSINKVEPDYEDAEIITIPSTCVAEGKKIQKCKVCSGDAPGHTRIVEVIPVSDSGHSYTKEVVKEATCTSAGYKYTACELCGAEKSETRKQIDPLGHNFVGNICDRCGYSKSNDKDDKDDKDGEGNGSAGEIWFSTYKAKLNGKIEVIRPQLALRGSADTTVKAPTYEGYTFDHWELTGYGKNTDGKDIQITADLSNEEDWKNPLRTDSVNKCRRLCDCGKYYYIFEFTAVYRQAQ